MQTGVTTDFANMGKCKNSCFIAIAIYRLRDVPYALLLYKRIGSEGHASNRKLLDYVDSFNFVGRNEFDMVELNGMRWNEAPDFQEFILFH